MNTGSLISLRYMPQSQLIQSLHHLFTTPEARDQLADETLDLRLSPEHWRLVLYRDLLTLHRWVVNRVTLAANGAQAGAPTPRFVMPPARVLSLLPHTALATHALRRAVPFAALGIPTLCGAPAPYWAEGSRITAVLARALGLEEWLHAERRSCEEAVARDSSADTLIVVTGRATTIRRIQRNARGPVLGCAGHCAVLLGPTAGALLPIQNSLVANRVKESCSTLRAILLCERYQGDVTAKSVFGGGTACVYTVSEALGRLHPSVIFVPEPVNETTPRPPDMLCGYRVLTCAADGSSESSPGFGADPVYGWPGDYLI